ncbi:hypothetical protein [Fodinibius halophilus]|uniref:Uncharacterized protein n=1 Tax=Fodinibius halophilus TaxID=1736908 RepID=A0A6M1T3X4_9BACT|nr:hypothetical protein [Fodinibius halophilus]NGP87925.1 hypothetical protein [Fodinibius halophilus]
MKISKEDLNSRPSKKDTAVHVTVPAKVAYNLDEMQKVTSIVLDRLNCPACHSGFDIRFDIEKRFNFNEDLELIDRPRFR